jgi:hypothetical protein
VTGTFLLAGSEMYRLAQGGSPDGGEAKKAAGSAGP